MRKEYEMSEAQYIEMKAAMQATPVMMIGEQNIGRSAQENANDAWIKLGKEMGFDGTTAGPSSNKDRHFFTAEES